MAWALRVGWTQRRAAWPPRDKELPLPRRPPPIRLWTSKGPTEALAFQGEEYLSLGQNLDDPKRGVGIVEYLGASSLKMAGLGSLIDSQLEDDPRIDSSTTAPITQNADGTWKIAITVYVNGTAVDLNFQLGPNGLTLAR